MTCLKCGAATTYQGLTSQECATEGCPNYRAPGLLIEGGRASTPEGTPPGPDAVWFVPGQKVILPVANAPICTCPPSHVTTTNAFCPVHGPHPYVPPPSTTAGNPGPIFWWPGQKP